MTAMLGTLVTRLVNGTDPSTRRREQKGGTGIHRREVADQSHVKPMSPGHTQCVSWRGGRCSKLLSPVEGPERGWVAGGQVRARRGTPGVRDTYFKRATSRIS
ncbi:hypothetical protein PENSPDRAFT_14311 [Peniophora sp. CONT]|nr:hypothetical protein PENSPDRAFT_14311 [Peniophora sp. CONT]